MGRINLHSRLASVLDFRRNDGDKWVLHPQPSTSRAFLSLWLIGWAFGEGWAVYQWFWAAFGREIVRVREGQLTIKRDILGRGTQRTFPIGTVANLRASGVFPSSWSWNDYRKLAGGTVAFDSQGKTSRFGVQLTEPEAQEVVRELMPYLLR